MAGEVGLIDVIEWQAWVDMESGRELDEVESEWQAVADILALRPYPGDLDPGGNLWVTSHALDAVKAFSPPLIILHYANQSFRAMFGGISDAELDTAFDEVKSQIEMFIDETGYVPVIIGLGGFRRLEGFVDLSGLDGLVLGGGMPGNMAGLYSASRRDLERLRGEPRVERLVSRDEFREEFGGCDAYYERFPDWLLELEDGWGGRCAGVMARRPDRIGRKDDALPVHSELGSDGTPGEMGNLEEIRPLVEEAVRGGRKVALILVEGWVPEDFPFTFKACPNRRNWFRYGLKCSLNVIFTGLSPFENPYPPMLRMYREDDAYPFSVIYNEPSSDLLGQTVPGLSVAVGNRSILPHALFGADITLECYARYIYNYGSMAILQGRGLRPSSYRA